MLQGGQFEDRTMKMCVSVYCWDEYLYCNILQTTGAAQESQIHSESRMASHTGAPVYILANLFYYVLNSMATTAADKWWYWNFPVRWWWCLRFWGTLALLIFVTIVYFFRLVHIFLHKVAIHKYVYAVWKCMCWLTHLLQGYSPYEINASNSVEVWSKSLSYVYLLIFIKLHTTFAGVINGIKYQSWLALTVKLPQFTIIQVCSVCAYIQVCKYNCVTFFSCRMISL